MERKVERRVIAWKLEREEGVDRQERGEQRVWREEQEKRGKEEEKDSAGASAVDRTVNLSQT